MEPSRETHPPAGEPEKTHQLLQADVWAPEAEILLDRIGVEPGWRCVDLGCGETGILASLARRVGAAGLVVGTDLDPSVAQAASKAASGAGARIGMVVADLLAPAFAESSFDLVHLRFALHLVEPVAAIEAMRAIAKPGGFVAIQEPDLASWRYQPPIGAWTRILDLLGRAIALSGDPNVGRRVPDLMKQAGLEDVEVRPTRVTLGAQHPHMRLPLAWAAAQRETILEHRLAEVADLDAWIADLEARLQEPGVVMVTPTTVQAWGRRPKAVENWW